MKVVVAPDKLRGTASSTEAARSLAEGVRTWSASAAVVQIPLADGGEGTAAILAQTQPSVQHTEEVPGPLGAPVRARWFELADGSAVVEVAEAAGLHLIPDPSPETARRASTDGAGHLIRAAVASGCERVLLAIGGTGSTDGGVGIARAFGWRFLDSSGDPISPGGEGLLRLDRIEAPPASALPRIAALCDVTAPLTGPQGAAHMFGPQKGAQPDDLPRLDEGLALLAEGARRAGIALVPDTRGAGAGGGAAFGCAAFLAARLIAGAPFVAETVGFSSALDDADVVVTAEGRLDQSSFTGKVTGYVVNESIRRGIPVIIVAGQVADGLILPRDASDVEVVSLSDRHGDLARTATQRVLAEAVGAVLEKRGFPS